MVAPLLGGDMKYYMADQCHNQLRQWRILNARKSKRCRLCKKFWLAEMLLSKTLKTRGSMLTWFACWNTNIWSPNGLLHHNLWDFRPRFGIIGSVSPRNDGYAPPDKALWYLISQELKAHHFNLRGMLKMLSDPRQTTQSLSVCLCIHEWLCAFNTLLIYEFKSLTTMRWRINFIDHKTYSFIQIVNIQGV